MNNATIIKDENIIDMRDYKEKKDEMKRAKKEYKKLKNIKKTAANHALCLVLILIISEIIMFLFIQPHTGISEFLAHEICMALTAFSGIILPRVYSNVKLSERASIRKLDILTIAILTVAAFCGPELVDNISGFLLSHIMTVEPNETESNTITSVIGAVVCAPIFEELICRFGFMELTRKQFSAPFVIMFSSFLFTILHSYNIQGLLNVFTSAIMMGIVYYYTRNIFLTIGEHAIHNALCCIIPEDFSLFGTQIYSHHNGFVLSSTVWIVLNAVLFIISAVVFVKYFVPKYMKKNKK